jgi:hypothetical protein
LLERDFSPPRDRATIEIRAHIVSVEKQVQRKQPEHARYSRGTQPAPETTTREQLVDHLVGQRTNLSHWFVRLWLRRL